MRHRITFISGDGIGPEVSIAARRCIEATGVKIDWEEAVAGEEARNKFGNPLPKGTLESIKRNRIAIKGPLITPIAEGFRSVNVQLRQSLDLFACVRPVKSYPGVKSLYGDIDIIIIRENTEDLYVGIEFERGKNETKKIVRKIEDLKGIKIRNDSGLSVKPISEFASRRIVNFAFRYAIEFNRKKITAVHKANIMKYTDGLFLEMARNVANKYKDKIIFEEAIVDNLAMQLVKNPHNYDVLVLPNLYGDIISDLCAGLVGGLGVCPGVNIGKDIAIFEPIHGAAPKYKNLNKVNPTAMILSGALMLRYIGELKAASKLEVAVMKILGEGKYVTYDLKEDRNDPTAVGTKEMTEAIIKEIEGET